jgi:outer membrane protein OmpU
MRESQMKKIIALAVAGAFVAPVMAADVTISGAMEMYYVDKSATTDKATMNEDSAIVFKASEELANGITIAADFNLAGDMRRDGGNSLDVSGAFGKVMLGDTSGAIDSVDDKTEVLIAFDTGIGGQKVDADGVSNDAYFAYQLPSIVPGLNVLVSFSPEDGGEGQLGALTAASGNTVAEKEQASKDSSGVAISYTVSGVRLAYAQEDVGTQDNTFYGISGKLQGVGFAYESGTSKAAAGTEDKHTSAALTYSMGDVTLAYAMATTKDAGVDEADATAVGVHYNMGGATMFVESIQEDVSNEDQIAVGILLAF